MDGQTPLTVAAAELGCHTPVLVTLAFPAEHKQPAQAGAVRGAAAGNAGRMAAGTATPARSALCEVGGLDSSSLPAAGGGAEAGASISSATIPARLSRRARTALGHVAIALQDPVLLAICR